MTSNAIRVGDTLRLKKDNPYGFGPALKTVTELRYRNGYKVPFVICGTEAFKPRDFQGHA